MDEEINIGRDTILELENQIPEYLKNLPPQILGVQKIENATILTMTPGAYNLNYHVLIDDKKFIFRVNIQPQSGLSNQIEYEYQVMKYLQQYQIAPRVYHLDNSKTKFCFGILIEEHLEGPWVSLSEEDAPEIAALLAKLHALDPKAIRLITWTDPLMNTLELVQSDMQEYQSKRSAEQRVIKLARAILEKIKPQLNAKRGLFQPDSINHTDTAIDNFLKTTQGLRLIDWEKPRYDDRSYDLGCFISEPTQLWCSSTTLSSEGQTLFLENYIRHSGKDGDKLYEKVSIREPLISLHWVFWGMNRLCDLKDCTTITELKHVHTERLARWERLADFENIEKIMARL